MACLLIIILRGVTCVCLKGTSETTTLLAGYPIKFISQLCMLCKISTLLCDGWLLVMLYVFRVGISVILGWDPLTL